MKTMIIEAGESLVHLLDYEDNAVRQDIRKGLALYRQGYVYNYKELQHYAGVVVYDSSELAVLLNLQDLAKSECDCGEGSFCPHRIAAFFYIYATVGRVGELLDKWKQQSTNKSILTTLKMDSAKSTAQPLGETSHSLADWVQNLERKYEQFLQQKRPRGANAYSLLYEDYFLPLEKAAPSQSPYRDLFMIHAGILTFMKMSDYMKRQPMSKSTFDAFVQTPLSQLIHDINQRIYRISQTSLPFAADSILYGTIGRTRELLFYSSAFQYERIELYRTIWSHLLKRQAWIKEEKLELEQQMNFPLESFIANAHLLFLESRDQQAVALLKDADVSVFPYALKWAKEHLYHKDAEKAKVWFAYIKEKMAPYLNTLPSFQSSRTIVSMLISLFEDYSHLLMDEPLYVEALRSLLPYSFVEYSQHLYEKGRFKQWLELQAAFRYDILEYDQSLLKNIEAANREWVLPVYHQSIQQLIEKKNRTSYDEAVYHLKKLKSVYEKLQQEHTFNEYMQQLIQSTKRLRAFQQALEKGNLIHD